MLLNLGGCLIGPHSGDHGPYNSWDRQPYLTVNGVDDGFPAREKLGNPGASIIKRLDTIEQNFLINGYNSVWTIDHGKDQATLLAAAMRTCLGRDPK